MGSPMLAAALFDWLYNAFGSVMAFFYALIPSYGFAIIMLTITVRVVLIPLTAKQVKSQRAMQQLQPELKRLQAKHKGDRQKLNEEMMKLYKENKANPLAGCLPLILQMPLFIILYRLIIDLSKVPPRHIPLGSELHQALVESSGKLESFGIDLSNKPASVIGLFLVAAVVATGYYQQKQMTARMSKDAINPQMQMVTKIMPAFFGLISLSVPAGVVLYFVVSNLWQIAQQAVAFRNRPMLVGEEDTSKPAGKSGGSGGAGGSGGVGAGAKGGGGAGSTKGGGAKDSGAKRGRRRRGRPRWGRLSPRFRRSLAEVAAPEARTAPPVGGSPPRVEAPDGSRPRAGPVEPGPGDRSREAAPGAGQAPAPARKQGRRAPRRRLLSPRARGPRFGTHCWAACRIVLPRPNDHPPRPAPRACLPRRGRPEALRGRNRDAWNGSK